MRGTSDGDTMEGFVCITTKWNRQESLPLAVLEKEISAAPANSKCVPRKCGVDHHSNSIVLKDAAAKITSVSTGVIVCDAGVNHGQVPILIHPTPESIVSANIVCCDL